MAYKIPESSEMTPTERLYLPELVRGIAITARHFLRNLFGQRDPAPDILARKGISRVSTVQYPEERAPFPPGYRGLHRLVPRDDGRPRCVACYMCATVCPAQCIYIEAGEYPVDDARENAVIEKYPTRFVIDELRCVVCGFCVEACPKDAIRMDTGQHAPSGYVRESFVFDIPKLLKGPPVSHPSDPWLKRDKSSAPPQHKEAHTRVGDADEHGAKRQH
ncbi:MAG: NADH-quinone oxidoreductase subunit I [Deltaproteobacteria bacterium]|nr:NADH-quinone oxidoreductase subunit I [Deltaproteobacteria bacterium]